MNKIKIGMVIGFFALTVTHQNNVVYGQNPSSLTAREISDYAEERYGPEIELISGEKYYYPYRKAIGTPYFTGEDAQIADIQVNGKVFEGQRIRFDIYNQVLVLEFIDERGAAKSIILSELFLDNFVVNGMLFRKFPSQEGSNRFGQVIYDGDIGCYYHWKVKYTLHTNVGERQYKFSDPIRQSNLMMDGEVFPYKSKKSFLKNFSVQEQAQIKSLIRVKGIRFRKASDLEMAVLMENINQICENED